MKQTFTRESCKRIRGVGLDLGPWRENWVGMLRGRWGVNFRLSRSGIMLHPCPAHHTWTHTIVILSLSGQHEHEGVRTDRESQLSPSLTASPLSLSISLSFSPVSSLSPTSGSEVRRSSRLVRHLKAPAAGHSLTTSSSSKGVTSCSGAVSEPVHGHVNQQFV